MKRSNVVAVLLSVIILALVGVSVFRATRQGDTLQFASHTITNDLWGAPPAEKLSSSVYLDKDRTFGWSWNRADPQTLSGRTFIQPIFPNVRIGATYGIKSNSDSFPLPAGGVRSLSLSVDYQYPSQPTGSYNLAYQMYFSDTASPATDGHPQAEVMIWLHHTFNQPADRYKGDFSDGTHAFELYAWPFSDGRQYYSFLMKGQPAFNAMYTVDAKKLLDSLSLDPKWYLLGVNLGNEIWDGSGKLEIRALTVSLNSKQI